MAHLARSNKDVTQMLPVKVEAPEETSHGVVLDVPDTSYMKEEVMEVLIGQEENQLCVKEESSTDGFPVSITPIKSEDDAETPLFSKLHEHLKKEEDCPTSRSTQQMTEIIGDKETGGAESTGNPHPNTGVKICNSSKTKVRAVKVRSKISWRKCAFGCESYKTLFNIPKERPVRQKWMELLSELPPLTSYTMFVCDRHFTEGCFLNLGQYQSGLSERIILAAGSVPTIKTPDGAARGGSSQDSFSHTEHHAAALLTPPVRSVGVQTTPSSVFTRTVSTQLSLGTLKKHFVRSKGVQAVTTMINKGTETKLLLDRSSTKTSASGLRPRPSKRPRLEEEEERGDEVEDEDVSDGILPQDPTYEPADSAVTTSTTAASVTEVPEVIDNEPTALEDAKYIVFESSLRQIFDTCPVCQHPCNVNRSKCGTLVSFTQKCPHCQYSRKWQSGPVTGSTPVGDLQLSAAVYFSGASFDKVAVISNAMNLQIHQDKTFRKHCRLYLEPAIFHKWTLDQKCLLEDLKKKGKVALCGDMRVDSPGQSAKFGTYTLMDPQSEKVVDLKLVQSNEVSGRYQMEKEGLRRSLDFLEENGLEIDCIVTDHRPHIKKCLRERDIVHYYDVSDVVKGLSKKLDKISKDKECLVVKKWLAAIKNHMYWTAYSSTSGPEKVAKWTSLINHIQDVHTHDDPLFPKCTHPDRVSRDPNKWFHPGTKALYKVEKMMLNNRVLEDVAKLSSNHQASSLESFHSRILRFTPKMSNSKYVGMMCRDFLAAMHHNENAGRTRAFSKGKLLFKTFPKFEKDQYTAKPVKAKATFGYVAALMHLVFDEVFLDPSKFVAQLKAVPVPKDLCAELERASEEDITAAKVSRSIRAVAGHQQVHQHAETPHGSHQDLETPGGSGEQ